MDVLKIKGVSKRVDGEYPCDIAGMFDVSSDEALTNSEAHLVKRLSGVRGGEIIEAFISGDTDVRMSLAMIVLARNGKDVEETLMWASKIGATRFELGADEDAAAEDDPEHPTIEDGQQSSPSTSGGTPSSTTSPDPPAEGLRAIGARG